MTSVGDAELGGFGTRERITGVFSRRARPEAGLLVLRARESHRTVVAVIAECREYSNRK